ncbi:capsular biosynthesis protein [Candidatus Accumulibacter sp. ACC003]|uniref:capsule biosynthesis protein n=1 Tax=Candidatus Accumulibacter sp. ACC003 TaxID=2823334 RepID=UPI0025BB30CB|nr:capsular biosynthesis protein [Candidatus Accumulibacter sp. ACC003]
MLARRSFLFLQGVCSPFFAKLADQLVADGHRVFKINFNAGDVAYWGFRRGWNYRGGLSGLRDFLDDKYHRYEITDQVLFGDRRPVHRPAVDRASALGIRTHVFEEGYLRPCWVTLERDGVNGHSLLPRDPDWFRSVGAKLRDYGNRELFKSPLVVRAAHDIAYHLAGSTNPILFPRYQRHAPLNAAVEYAGYAVRFSMLRFREPKDNALIDELASGGVPFYLLPLQLNSDAQIRDHCRFNDMNGVMESVMESFAMHAPNAARLVIKNHPLDAGLVNYRGVISDLERRFGLAGRIDYLESGDLAKLLRHAQGVVTVNSTVGIVSVGAGCPTVTLSDPIYNLPGLTFQGSVDDFWKHGIKPDTTLFRCFRKTLIHAVQVNGGFYCATGIRLAVANCRRFLEPERSPLDELL